MLAALDFYLENPKQIVLAGKKDSLEAREMLNKIHGLYLPNKTLSFVDPDRPGTGRLSSMVLETPQQDRRVKAYVCHNFSCSMPVTEWEALKKLLVTR